MTYKSCPQSGATLDPGERCDCREEEKRRFLGNERKAAEAAVKKGYPYLQWLSSSPIMVTGSENDLPLYPIDYPDTRPLCQFVSRCIPHGEGVDLREWLRKEEREKAADARTPTTINQDFIQHHQYINKEGKNQ